MILSEKTIQLIEDSLDNSREFIFPSDVKVVRSKGLFYMSVDGVRVSSAYPSSKSAKDDLKDTFNFIKN